MSIQRVGENPAMKLLTEYQAIEIINGVLRPIRSASQPAATAPKSRIHNVIVRTNATAVSGTGFCCCSARFSASGWGPNGRSARRW